MKKKLLFAIIGFMAIMGAEAQSSFGVKAGYTLITAKAKVEGFSASADESGFFVGLTSEFGVGESFAIQPELLYANAQDTGFLYVPVMAKYYITPEFSLQAGPQMNFALDSEEGENTFGLDAAFGAGFNINKNFFIDARYGLELTNRVADSEDFGGYEVKGSYNTLMVGVGYKF